MPSPSLADLKGFTQKIVVGVGDVVVSNSQNGVLTTYSLGSCIGVSIYDPKLKVGGLLHAMLPESSIDAEKALRQPAMFMDTGLPALFRAAYAFNADKHRLQICVAGGAQIMDPGNFFNIGRRNYASLMSILTRHGLHVQASQVGGLVSRTMSLNIRTGEVRLKVSGQKDELILFKG